MAKTINEKFLKELDALMSECGVSDVVNAEVCKAISDFQPALSRPQLDHLHQAIITPLAREVENRYDDGRYDGYDEGYSTGWDEGYHQN